jgi:hypothetical protein
MATGWVMNVAVTSGYVISVRYHGAQSSEDWGKKRCLSEEFKWKLGLKPEAGHP